MIDVKGFRNYPSLSFTRYGDNTLKPFAVYKLSRIEAALRRLDAAVAGLEAAAGSVALGGESPSLEAADLAALRARCDMLEAAARNAASGIDGTMARLKRLLEG